MRVRVCHNCREFVPIVPDKPMNLNILLLFEGSHRYHMVTTSEEKELDKSYKVFDYK